MKETMRAFLLGEYRPEEDWDARASGAPLEDRAMKMAAQFFGVELLPLLGITGKIRQIAPTEQIYLEMKDFYEDFNYLMEDGTWRHIEFESDSILDEDLRRFRAYEGVCSYYYQVEVITSVVCSSAVRELKTELREGLNTYQVHVIRLKDWSAERIIQGKLLKKGQGTLSRQDMVELLLTPLMGGTMPQKKRIEESLNLLRGVEDLLGKEDSMRMESMLFAFAMKFLKQRELNEVKEVFCMSYLGELLEEGGIQKGLEKGMGALIETCVELGHTYEVTMQKPGEKFSLSPEEAKAKMEKYWKTP